MKIWQFIGATSLLVLSSWAVGDVYKWVDEKGVTHTTAIKNHQKQKPNK